MKENSHFSHLSQADYRFYVPKRHILTVLGLIGFCCSYTLRYNLTVALVAMVNHTDVISNDTEFKEEECKENEIYINSSGESPTYKGEQYNWDAKTRGYILSAFFYCYFTTVFAGGFLAKRYGANRLFGGGVFVTAILTLLTPVAVRWGAVPFIICRALEGIGEGVTLPAMNMLIANWAPKQERSRISSTIFSGYSIGTFFSLMVSGWLCTLDFLGGWPAVFYVTGAITCIWYIFWVFFVYESPEKHPGISKEELALCLEDEQGVKHDKTHTTVKWKKIVFSLPMWAVIIAQSGTFFSSSLLTTHIPMYLSKVLHLDLSSIGLITGVAHIFEWIGIVMSSILADKLISSETFGRTTVRKIFNSLGFFGSGFGFICISLSGCHSTTAVAIFGSSMFIQGAKLSGFNVAYLEMCPELAGSLYGIANGIACITGMIGPIMVGHFTESGDTLHNWSKVFYVGASVIFVTGAVFAIFASTERQPWLVEATDSTRKSSLTVKEENISLST